MVNHTFVSTTAQTANGDERTGGVSVRVCVCVLHLRLWQFVTDI